MVKDFNKKIIETEGKHRTFQKRNVKGRHIILDNDISERLNRYCNEGCYVKRQIVNKIVLKFLDEVKAK